MFPPNPPPAHPTERTDLNLDGPVTTVVTGGTKGIGRAIALDFAAPGRLLVLGFANDVTAARRTEGELVERGADVELVQGDVAEVSVHQRYAAVVAERGEGLGQLVHCAVRATTASFADLDPEQLRRAVDINGTSFILLAHALREQLRRGSTLVFLTSIGAQRAIPDYLPVGAPKALAESLVRYLAIELASAGVRAHALSCSSLPTEAFHRAIPDAERHYERMADRNPSLRNITFEEVASAARFLCSTAARMVNGQVLTVDGGLYARL